MTVAVFRSFNLANVKSFHIFCNRHYTLYTLYAQKGSGVYKSWANTAWFDIKKFKKESVF